jgi:hypothetical protein|tara:strand:+ start:1483 stop:2028 length:546 start_codon:yes stop_codon:yes gene_type:complete
MWNNTLDAGHGTDEADLLRRLTFPHRDDVVFPIAKVEHELPDELLRAMESVHAWRNKQGNGIVRWVENSARKKDNPRLGNCAGGVVGLNCGRRVGLHNYPTAIQHDSPSCVLNLIGHAVKHAECCILKECGRRSISKLKATLKLRSAEDAIAGAGSHTSLTCCHARADRTFGLWWGQQVAV